MSCGRHSRLSAKLLCWEMRCLLSLSLFFFERIKKYYSSCHLSAWSSSDSSSVGHSSADVLLSLPLSEEWLCGPVTPEDTLLIYVVYQLAPSPFCCCIFPVPYSGRDDKPLVRQHASSLQGVRWGFWHVPFGRILVCDRHLASLLPTAARHALGAAGGHVWQRAGWGLSVLCHFLLKLGLSRQKLVDCFQLKFPFLCFECFSNTGNKKE